MGLRTLKHAKPQQARFCCGRDVYKRQVSSATLRNEMAALTKLGLLEQPHTSAGRVPSAKGYRYYLSLIHICGEAQSVLPARMCRSPFRFLYNVVYW